VIHQASRFVSHSLLGWARAGGAAQQLAVARLLNDKLQMDGIAEAIAQKQLHAVAVTAFGYESGQAVTFYQGGGTIDAWLRHRRIGVPTQLSVDHLLASSAIPLLFAPVKIGEEYFGDGAVRQSAPISPALHLGASRVLVVGVSGNPRGFDPSSRCNVPTPVSSRPWRRSAGTCSTARSLTAWKATSNCCSVEPVQSFVARRRADSRAGRGAGGGAGDCAQPADRRDRRAPSPGIAGGVAPVPARAGCDQDQWGGGAELSAVRGGVLQRAD
jgi:predicted acylesterase/phospholipase RssA